MRRIVFACALALMSSAAAHAVCGDVTGDQVVTATDSLAVLRNATGLEAPLSCAVGMSVFDADDNPMGTLVGYRYGGDTSAGYSVYVPELAGFVSLVGSSNPAGLRLENTAIYYAEPDCQGDAYSYTRGGYVDPNKILVLGVAAETVRFFRVGEPAVDGLVSPSRRVSVEGACDNTSSTMTPETFRQVTEVPAPFPTPIATPLRFVP